MYALTARLGNVRLALAIAVKYDLEIYQMYVFTAFLGVDLEEEIDIHPAQGYFCLLHDGSPYKDPRLRKTSRKMVLRLTQSLYSLKLSLHVWHGTFKDIVISIGFMSSHVDGGLFMLHDQNEGIAVGAVVLYVDDLLIIANKGLID